MIVVNRIKDVISVSAGDKEFSVMYDDSKFAELVKISEASLEVKTVKALEKLVEKVEALCADSAKEKVEAFHPDIYVDSKSNKYYLKIKKGVISSIPMPEAFVRRLEESIDKGIDISPLMKCWMRFLRNKKSDMPSFANKFFNYIDMKYVRPERRDELLKEGYSSELATEMATTYQVKITQEGLINCYKVSTEIDWKYEADGDGEPVRKSLYARTFDPVTGEITGDERESKSVEERLFMPAVMGDRGDKFYCEGSKRSTLGHVILVGHNHRLPDWSFVNTDDNVACVKGLHVGGLNYIACYSGEIHNVFIDPMHVGAIPDDTSGAMRVIQYFVHSSMAGVNDSVYHSSKYAKSTEKQWKEIKKGILEQHGELEAENAATTKEVEAL